jgi:ATP-citrate lyase beta-subunit
MPRQKISEYRSKQVIASILQQPYEGWSIGSVEDLAKVQGHDRYVVKVDQAVKGRFKKGLVLLDVTQKELKKVVRSFESKGFSSFLVEPYVVHAQLDERYIAMTYDRTGYRILSSRKGGIDIEQHAESITTHTLDSAASWKAAAEETGIAEDILRRLLDVFKANHFAFLEINPYMVDNDTVTVLDCAIEVDDAALYFVSDWNDGDFRYAKSNIETVEEHEVKHLDANSPASFNLSTINSDGSVFLLLSGGGASVVIADEVYNLGLGKGLANYGEYSGNPNTEETFIYTNQVLKLMLASKAKKKVLFVGGAVANFTDIANTFAGIIQALDMYGEELARQGAKIYVRRGGPRQEVGLTKIKQALEKYHLLGGVYSPATSIPDALHAALKGVK